MYCISVLIMNGCDQKIINSAVKFLKDTIIY